MLKALAVLLGLAFISFGILGFLPEFTTNNKLFGLFAVNAMHNIVHISTGVIALLCGFSSRNAAKGFFIIFGLVYAAVAALGFYQGEGVLLNLIAINNTDNWLHASIAVVCLYFGIFYKNS